MSASAVRLLAVAALGAAALAGCGATSDEALRTSLAALRTPAPAAATTPPLPSRPCSDLTASLRPSGSLPAPGHMPAGSTMAAIARHGTLVAGVDQNTLLLSYRNPINGQLEGFEIDLLREVARAIFGDPDRIEFKAVSTADQRIRAAQSGRVDVVADAVTITCDRRAQVAFSTVYYHAVQRVLVPKTSHARSIADLAGKRVCATGGTTTIKRLKRLPEPVIAFPVAQRTDCLVDLQEGVVDAISSDDAILLGYKAQDPYTKVIGAAIADEPYGMAMSRTHPDLVRFVNGVLARMRADGRWAAIYRRWFGRYQPTPAPPRARYSD